MYTYATGAKYEGEWRNNVKEGRGVYYFPKGGMYEGEWSNGIMAGLGVRTYASGEVKSGRWASNQLVQSMDLWQCTAAVEGATEAALAARSVEVGGGSLDEAFRQVALSPRTWLLVVALAVNGLSISLGPSISLVTATLAPANRPLMLIAAGMMLDLNQPQPRQVADLVVVLASRLVAPLLLGGVCIAAVQLLGGVAPFMKTLGLPLLISTLAFMAPPPFTILNEARRFRLNMNTAASLLTTANILCLPLFAALTLAAAFTRLTSPTPYSFLNSSLPSSPPVPPTSSTLLPLPAPASPLGLWPTALTCLVAAAALGSAARWLYRKYDSSKKVPMVYSPGSNGTMSEDYTGISKGLSAANEALQGVVRGRRAAAEAALQGLKAPDSASSRPDMWTGPPPTTSDSGASGRSTRGSGTSGGGAGTAGSSKTSSSSSSSTNSSGSGSGSGGSSGASSSESGTDAGGGGGGGGIKGQQPSPPLPPPPPSSSQGPGGGPPGGSPPPPGRTTAQLHRLTHSLVSCQPCSWRLHMPKIHVRQAGVCFRI